MSNYDTTEQIKSVIRDTLMVLGAPNLKVVFEMNYSFTRRMGDAEYFPAEQSGLVRFSMPLWPLASPTERYETIVHEVCHIVDKYFSYTKAGWGRDSSHGYRWQSLMIKCGLEPTRCHTVQRPPELKRKPQTKFTVYCGCKEHRVTNTILKRMSGGTKYRCQKCGSYISTTKE